MSALDKQEGGGHYKDFPIQPVEYITKNNIPYLEGNVIKYTTRHNLKNGLEDINKAIHYLELIKEIYYGENTNGGHRDGPQLSLCLGDVQAEHRSSSV